MNHSSRLRQPPGLIIAAMKGLLGARREKRISRMGFLKAWGRLRQLLADTKEYQLWRHMVKERAGGACESCARPGHHAHHIVPISRDPDKALDPLNGRFTCKQCHDDEHEGKLLRARRRSNRPHSRSATAHRSSRPSPAHPSSNPPKHEPRAARPPRAIGSTDDCSRHW